MWKRVVWLASIAVSASSIVCIPAYAVQPKLEVVAEWNRLSYDLGSDEERAYEDAQVWKKALLHGVKVDSKGTIYVTTARWGGQGSSRHFEQAREKRRAMETTAISQQGNE